MTERFIIDDDGLVFDKSDSLIYIDNEDCCEKLNELNDENEQLKKEKQTLDDEVKSYIKSLRETLDEREELFNENAQLKQEKYDLKKWLSTVPQMENKIKELKQENEKYRQILLDFGVRTVFKENTVLRNGECEITFEQYLRDNPMPTKELNEKGYSIVKKNCK